MEEEKAAAYYDELNRKGEGARRFKQGLGFSSSDPQSTSFPSKPPSTSSSSFLSGFVRAGATPAPAQPTKQPPPPPPHEPSRTGRHSRSPSPSRRHRTRSRSPSRSRRHRSRSRERRRRSRSREREREDRRASRRRSRSRSRSRSPSRRSGRSSYSEDRHGDRRRDDGGGRRGSSKGRGGREGGKVDYSRLIEGYDRMTPAERVKAKMKLQLSETASKDSTLGNATVGWERFEFNKDAPLDEDDNDVEGQS
uniref:Uncharacterized protein n=1 Tax=Oryza meridionalis TaxID=40149 RepID=A0A0E0C6C7_9ORYZ